MVVSALTRTTRGFLVARSVTVISFAAGFTDTTVAARLRKVPETMASAFMREPSAFFSPNTRTWSPVFNSLKELGLRVVKAHRIGGVAPEVYCIVRLDHDGLRALQGMYGHGELPGIGS